MKDTEFTFGCGCEPSKLDGTEHILQADEKLVFPKAFDWRDSMPPVRNQGHTNTCVCQTLTGMLDFYTNAVSGKTGVCNNFSIDELFNCRANKQGFGMTIKEALHYLRHHGLKGQKINGYSKINSIESLKYALLMFGPCAGGCGCYQGNIANKFWTKNGKFLGGHCITFTGYNEKGFTIRNSWGEQWADKGYVLMPYNEFPIGCFEVWTFTI